MGSPIKKALRYPMRGINAIMQRAKNVAKESAKIQFGKGRAQGEGLMQPQKIPHQECDPAPQGQSIVSAFADSDRKINNR